MASLAVFESEPAATSPRTAEQQAGSRLRLFYPACRTPMAWAWSIDGQSNSPAVNLALCGSPPFRGKFRVDAPRRERDEAHGHPYRLIPAG
jgi:hypothetical protein